MRGFSKQVKEVFENFKFNNTIDELDKQGILYNIVQHFAKAPLDKDSVSHEVMGRIYEELIRKTSEATNEEAGEHFTPREVIQLMVNLIFSEDEERLKKQGGSVSIYDPAAGTGGMLSMAENHLHDDINQDLRVELFGQELLPFAYAICKSDMMIKELNLENIKIGNSLTDQDGFADQKFHYMLSNPPFGVDWGKYSTKISAEAEKGLDGKYGAGLPRKSDGSLLFLMHMISKMKPKEKEKIMYSFESGEIDILVATSVIEVGVDVPNATLMVIENSERLGLSQLHQLRGRIGRGTKKSTCMLLYGEKLSDTAKKRLRIIFDHDDGFLIAEEDLKIRGPGEFLGLKQSGLPSLRIASLERDEDILDELKRKNLSEEDLKDLYEKIQNNKKDKDE